jgi:hypothetical protein
LSLMPHAAITQVLGVYDVQGYLLSVLSHVLPSLMAARNRTALDALAALFDRLLHGALSSSRSSPEKKQSRVAMLIIHSKTGPHVLQRLLMGGAITAATAASTTSTITSTTDLSFLLSFYPENGPKNLITQDLRHLLSLLVWELAGPQHRAAAAAIRCMAAVVDCTEMAARRPALEEASQVQQLVMVIMQRTFVLCSVRGYDCI